MSRSDWFVLALAIGLIVLGLWLWIAGDVDIGGEDGSDGDTTREETAPEATVVEESKGDYGDPALPVDNPELPPTAGGGPAPR